MIEPLFHNISLTRAVIFCVPGCCPEIVLVGSAVRIVPLKLYAVVQSIPTPPSDILVIIKPHAKHSGHELFENVKVGAV